MNTKKESSSTKTKKTSKFNISKSYYKAQLLFEKDSPFFIIIEITLLAKKY